MNLIIGLGNPGRQYKNTRHNVGFAVLDKMAERAAVLCGETAAERVGFKFVKKFNCEIAIYEHAAVLCLDIAAERSGEVAMPTRAPNKTILAKPQTFMNLSGQSVQAIMSFYKISSEDLVVIHDDLDIELGEFKIQKNRSSAGHNGVQSIIDAIGTKDFTRVRIGIKNLENKIDAEKFVLGRFGEEELEVIEGVIGEILKFKF